MRFGKSVGVIIPALDEAKGIGRVISDIPDWVDRIVVVDNGSRDATIQIARDAGAEVVSEPYQGYGSACLKGIATVGDVDITVFVDGDYSDHADRMGDLVDPIAKDDADFVVGSRRLGKAELGSLTVSQRFGNRLACLLMRWIWKSDFTDLGPFRAISRASLERLNMQDRTYGWTVEMQIRALQYGLRAIEVPADYRNRIGTSKVSGTIRGTISAGYKILTTIGRFALSPNPAFHGSKQADVVEGQCIIAPDQ